MLKKVVLIGDCHGCLDELKALIKRVRLSSDSTLIFLGDLIDKGPYSEGVVQYVKELSDSYPTIVLMGNHEEKHLRRHRQGNKTEVFLSESSVAFIRENCVPFYRFRSGEKHFICVHGGIYPAFYKHNGNIPDLSTQGKWTNKEQSQIERLFITRYVRPDGNVVVYGEERPCDVFWAEKYDGRDGIVFYGHNPWQYGVEIDYCSYGLDTSCVYGGHLTSAIVDNGNVSLEQVKALKQYADRKKDIFL